MIRTRALIATIAAAMALAVPQSPMAVADTADPVESLADQVAAAIETSEPVISPTRGGADLVAESANGSAQVALALDAEEISLTDLKSGTSVAIGLPVEAEVERPAVAQDGTVIYQESGEGGVDIAAQVIADGSIRVQTIISDRTSPHEFSYPLTLPAGTILELTDDGGVLASDAHGGFVAGVRPPWAKDSQGNDVATAYRIEGNTIVQTVAESDARVYPVVADPWLGIDLIEKVTRVWDSAKKGYRYSVFPTWWGRVGASRLARGDAWSETKKKGVPQTSTLENQFLCHYDNRVLVAFKGSWNLEAYTKDRGYWGFMANLCN